MATKALLEHILNWKSGTVRSIVRRHLLFKQLMFYKLLLFLSLIIGETAGYWEQLCVETGCSKSVCFDYLWRAFFYYG